MFMIQFLFVQQYEGFKGSKQVVCRVDGVQVFYNGVVVSDWDVLVVVVLVVDGYWMFLIGFFYFFDGNLSFELVDDEMVNDCDCISIVVVCCFGYGFLVEDCYQLFIDCENYLLCCVCFMMEGLELMWGVIVEVDFFDYRQIVGVIWLICFYECLCKFIFSLLVYDWCLIGFDVNCGLKELEIIGMVFVGKVVVLVWFLVKLEN